MPTTPKGRQSSTGGVSAASARKQLDQILASRHFVNAQRLSRFLQFVAEKTLEGQGGQVKESLIGLQVFDRPPSSYDPGVDPIVRVQAGRLRAKLKEYYEREGAEDPVLIEVPRGRYVARFRMRSAEVLPSAGAGAETESDYWRATSVAVLPFVNMSPDPENEYFSDGLTEELIHSLASVPCVHVAARTSAFQFKGKARDVREIGRCLGVGKVLEGSVRRSGERLRITAQLINVTDGCQLWSERYDRTITDIFAIQDEIADAIGKRFSAQLAETDRQLPARHQTANIEAFNHYLRGRYQWNKRTEQGVRAGVGHFQEAIRFDATYARAYSGLADCHLMLGMSAAEAPENCMPLARQAALRALEIDDRLGEAHTSLAAVMANFAWERAGAEREFHRALGLDQSYATLHHWFGFFLLAPQRQLAEAVDEVEWAMQLDPISLPINADLAMLHVWRGHYDAAIRQCKKALELDPNYHRAYWFLGAAHDQHEDFHAAVTALEKALALCGGNAFRSRILGALGLTFARWGKRERANAILGKMETLTETGYVDQFDIAQINAGLGETDKVMRRLERAARERSSFLVFMNVLPAFQSLRSDPRFEALLSQLSLTTARGSGRRVVQCKMSLKGRSVSNTR